MLTNNDLRKKIQVLSEEKGLEFIDRALLVNDVFPKGFNRSIGEEPIMRYFGQYIPIKKSWSFSVWQPCIRFRDFKKEVCSNSRMHTALFEMVDIGGIHLTNRKNVFETIREKSIKTAYNFLVKRMEIDPKRIYVSYFSGGPLRVINSNLNSRKYIKADIDTVRHWQELGLCDRQFLPDATQQTFVLTFFPFEFYAGYRSEIFIKQPEKNNLIEVGTFQFLNFKTKIDESGNLIDIQTMSGGLGGLVIGLERLLMVVNNLPDIIYCNHIFPLYEEVLKLSKKNDKLSARVLVEALRSMQAIMVDAEDLTGRNNNKRRYKLNRIIRSAKEASDLLKIDLKKQLPRLLKMNINLQPWFFINSDSSANVADRVVKIIRSFD